MRAIRHFIALVLTVSACVGPAMGEGIASMTDVAAANQDNLKLHKLKVDLKERKGMTSIHLYVTPSAGAKLVACEVVIHRAGQGDDAEVARFGLDYTHRPMPFWVSKDLVDEVAITYRLVDEAGDHVFKIKRGRLRAVAESAKRNP